MKLVISTGLLVIVVAVCTTVSESRSSISYRNKVFGRTMNHDSEEDCPWQRQCERICYRRGCEAQPSTRPCDEMTGTRDCFCSCQYTQTYQDSSSSSSEDSDYY